MALCTLAAAAAAAPGACCRARRLAAAPLPLPPCVSRPAGCWSRRLHPQHHCGSRGSAGQPAASRLVAAASAEGTPNHLSMGVHLALLARPPQVNGHCSWAMRVPLLRATGVAFGMPCLHRLGAPGGGGGRHCDAQLEVLQRGGRGAPLALSSRGSAVLHWLPQVETSLPFSCRCCRGKCWGCARTALLVPTWVPRYLPCLPALAAAGKQRSERGPDHIRGWGGRYCGKPAI